MSSCWAALRPQPECCYLAEDRLVTVPLSTPLAPGRMLHSGAVWMTEVPSIARAWPALPQVPRDHGAEFQHPAPHRPIGDIEPAFGEELLHVAVAQGEPEIKPNRMLDDRRREAMSTIREMGHARTLSYRLLRRDPLP